MRASGPGCWPKTTGRSFGWLKRGTVNIGRGDEPHPQCRHRSPSEDLQHDLFLSLQHNRARYFLQVSAYLDQSPNTPIYQLLHGLALSEANFKHKITAGAQE